MRPPGSGKFATIVNRWNRMTRGQHNEFGAPIVEERICLHQQRVGATLRKRFECSIDLAVIARIKDLRVKPELDHSMRRHRGTRGSASPTRMIGDLLPSPPTVFRPSAWIGVGGGATLRGPWLAVLHQR